jgi:cadmium resistance protein CadD (predicted permease)
MVGQTIGFTIVIIISLVGMALGFIIPTNYLDLVGFFPLCMGLLKLYEIIAEKGICCCFYSTTDGEYSKLEYDLNHYQGDLDVTYINDSREYDTQISDRNYAESLRCDDNGVDSTGKALADDQKFLIGEGNIGVIEEKKSNLLTDIIKTVFQSCLDPFTLEVTLFALFCSSDNIGIYIAIFISLDPWEVSIVVGSFYVMLLMSIIGAMILVQYKPIAEFFENNASYLVPALLIPLGLYILSDSIIWPF